MKFFALIFSFYLSALSMVPCNDAVKYSQISSGTAVAESHTENIPHSDQCSPFCICSCCGISADFKLSHLFIKENNVKNNFSSKFSPRSFLFISSYNGSIWQPPKINA